MSTKSSIHSTAVVDEPCEIGEGTRIWHFCHICAGAKIGAGCSLGQSTMVAGEAMCRAYHDRYGLDYVGLRYMNVYGPRQDQHAVYSGVIPIMLNKIDTGEAPVINGDGSQAYDFIYVDDVARSNVLALQSSATDEFYNVGTGVQTTIRKLCDTILDLKSSNLKVTYKSYSENDARRLVQNRIGCTIRAEKELGFLCDFQLREGLNRLIDWRRCNQ